MADSYRPIPIQASQRHIILDALRGFALLGICLANFPEFSLFSFLDGSFRMAMPSAEIDQITYFLLYFFVDGKFYTIFSLLFGIGFSIILDNCSKRGANGLKIFYRRMIILLMIGFLHLLFVWSGDILMLYAIVGMILPIFLRLSDKAILRWALFLLFIPVVIDTICQIFELHPSAFLVGRQWYYCDMYGITEGNFAFWLRDASSYGDVFKFLVQGAFERMSEFVDGNRYFKVLGLFLIGYYIGRHKFFTEMERYSHYLKKLLAYGLGLGFPLTALYAWSAANSHPFGEALHSLFYFVSVYLTSFGYIAAICLIYLKYRKILLWKIFALPGRMALTCYISQSVAGMFIFYGIGAGLGATIGLFNVEIIAILVYLFEIAVCYIWFIPFRFGPLEWIWRCFTYGRLFPIINKKSI